MGFVADAPADMAPKGFVPDAPPPRNPWDRTQGGNTDMLGTANAALQEGMSHAPLLDAGLAAASHAIVGSTAGGLAGLAARLTGHDPEAAHKWVDDNLVYHVHPNTQAYIDSVTKPVDAALAPVNDALNSGIAAVKDKIPQSIRDTAGMVAGTAGDLMNAAPVVGGAFTGAGALADASAAAKATGAAAETYGKARFAAADTPADATEALAKAAREPTPVETAQAMGLKLRPSDVASSTLDPASLKNRVLESAAGSADTAKAFGTDNIRNVYQPLALKAGAFTPEQLAASNGKLTPQLFADARAPLNAVWDKVGKIPGEPADISGDIGAISTKGSSTELANYQAKLQKDYGTVGSSADAITDIRELRARATKWLNSGDPKVEEQAYVARKTADVIEDVLARRAAATGDTTLSQEFADSRTQMAKLHTLEDSSTGGIIDPKKVLREQNNGVPLTGELQQIAYGAEHFPNVSRHPSAYNVGANTPIPGSVKGGISSLLGAVPGRMLDKAAVNAAANADPRDLNQFFRSGPAPKKPPFAGMLPSPGDVSIVPTSFNNEGLNPGDHGMVPGHPGQAREAAPPTALIPPASQMAIPNPNAAASGILGDSPGATRAALSHPGAAPLDLGQQHVGYPTYPGDAPAPLSLAPGLGMNGASTPNDGIPLSAVLREAPMAGVSGRSSVRRQELGRALRVQLSDAGTPPNRPSPNPGDMSAEERGKALALILEGKPLTKADRTLGALAKAVRAAQGSN